MDLEVFREVDDRSRNVRTFRKVGLFCVQSINAELLPQRWVEDCLFSAEVRPLSGVALEYVLTAGGGGGRGGSRGQAQSG